MTRAALFALPVAVYFGAVAIVDPFDYFGWTHVIPEERKAAVSGKTHYTLWKALEFSHSPTPRIILGDSRMAHLPAKDVEAVTGKPVYNFSFGGGTIPEMVDAFWFAAHRVDLQEVTLGISFFNFNAHENMNRFEEAQVMLDHPDLYLVNRTVAETTGLLLWERAFGRKQDVERPPMNRDEFWRYQLDVAATRLYGQYAYPGEYEKDLERIADYCRDHHVAFTIVVPPSHVELQKRVDDFGLGAEQARFRRFIRKLAPTIDFDVPTELTRDRSAFGDPFHPTATKAIIDEIWGTERRYAEHREIGDDPSSCADMQGSCR